MTATALFMMSLIYHIHGSKNLVRKEVKASVKLSAMKQSSHASTPDIRLLDTGVDDKWWWGRRRAPPTTTAPPTEDIDFGGNSHSIDSKGRLERPEFVKSEACTTNKCEDCADKTASGCWNGASWVWNTDWSWMQVYVNANDPKDHYVLEVFASCSSTTGKWMVYPKEIVNADVKVYLDGVLKKSLQDADSNCASGQVGGTNGLYGAWNCETSWGNRALGYSQNSGVDLNIASGQKARIRIVLTPTSPGSLARAKLGIFAVGIDKGVDQCMSTKECLSDLGDGSPESFELRNSNLKQRDCLSGDSESSTCTKWKDCLSDDQEKKLLAFLRASLRASALEEAGVVTQNLKTNEVACLDPSSADPESWECECVDMIVEKCGSADDETCMFNTMCAHADVCAEWKTASDCPTDLEQNAAATKRSSHVSTHSANISLLDTGLDNTLQGKCSQ